MAKCKYCGRTIKKQQYICPWCKAWLTEQGAWQQKLPTMTEWDSAAEFYPPDHVCEMCESPNGKMRSDGASYCDDCWKIWKH